MCTLTLSTTTSASDSAIGGLSHSGRRLGCGRQGFALGDTLGPDELPDDEEEAPGDPGTAGDVLGFKEARIRLPPSVQYRIGFEPSVPVVTNMPVSAENQGESSGTMYSPRMEPSAFLMATIRLPALS
jgi:hypothetical protein